MPQIIRGVIFEKTSQPDRRRTLAGRSPGATKALSTPSLRLLAPADDNGERLEEWISTAQEANLPHVHSFIRGPRLDHDTVPAALTSEYHNGGTEGVNTKTKLIKRQMYGRAGFDLLRHRILLE